MDSITITPQRDLIFISYSHLDKQWLDRLQILLKPFIREKQISVWIDPYIQVGDRWERKIDEALKRTKIAVLLISPNFLASDFVADVELPAILSATERGDAVLFCVPISSVPKSPTLMKLSKYQWARGTEEPLGLIQDEEMRNNALVRIIDTLVTAFPLPVAPVTPPIEKETDFPQNSHVPIVFERTSTNKQMGKLHGIPPQRPHFLPRPEELTRLKAVLLTQSKSAVGISGVRSKFGLHGQGGIGKSVLAIALANDDEVRHAFPEGIYWITLGQAPGILGLQDSLITDISGKRTDLTGLEPCKKLLKELLEGKCCLLVLDDLWRYEDALAFDVLDAGSKLLITTRDATLITALGAYEERLDRVNRDLAQELLAQWAGQPRASLPPVAQEVAEHCGRIPLALALAGARVRDGMAWENLRDALARGHIEFLDHPYGSIFKSMRCSVDALPKDMRQRYMELAIFPEDTIIPESAIYKLWHQTGSLDSIQAKSLLNTFERKGLLYTVQGQHEGGLTFHDLQQDFLRLIADDLPAFHAQLLQAYRNDLGNGPKAKPISWSRLPADDRYIWSYLAYHLVEAGCSEELQAVVQDLRYLAKKIFLFKAFSVESDLETADRSAGNPAIQALRHTMAQSGHLLTGFLKMEDVLLTLYTHLRDDPDLASMADQFESSTDISFLKPLWPMPDRPHSALSRTLEGHTSWVSCCAMDSQSKWLVSGSGDNTLRVWELETGKALRALEGHTGAVFCCAVDSEGKWIVSGSGDHTLRVWEAATGALLRTLAGHTDRITCSAVDPQGKWLVSGSDDGTLRVWEFATGTPLRTIHGRTKHITCCAVDPQGKWIISGAEDATLYLWEAATGALVCAFEGHTEWIHCCAIDSQGKWLVSGSGDHTLRVWDLATGKALRALEGHTGVVFSCAVDPEGKWIVSGADDNTLRFWDAGSGAPLHTLEGHADWVRCCAIDSQGKWLVSGGNDRTLRLWDVATCGQLHTDEGHTRSVHCCAVDSKGKWIVLGDDAGTLRLLKAPTGERLRTLEGHTRSVHCCAIDPQGRWLISGGKDDTLRVWDLATGTLLRTLTGHTNWVRCCAIDPRGNWIVSGSNDRTLRVWEAATGALLRTLEGHMKEITCCAVDPQGKWIVSGARDGTLRFWDATAGTSMLVLRIDDSLTGCAWFPVMRRIVASGGKGLYVFEFKPGKRLTNGKS